ncbi:hypothetical protein [Kutzneria sp. NPDC051319]|uniref:hypothetical protein n=1 Tax=Kutzneria sp. NPDC051319 TaxID=3155047 RepID=UPI00342B54F3
MNLFAGGGLLDILLCLALLYILYRIPTWILGAVRLNSGRTLVGSMVKSLLMAKVFGAIANRPAQLSAGERARRTWRPPPDPAWPGKIHAWYGVDGPRSLSAIEQRTRAWQTSERAHHKPPSTVTPARFQQAAAQTPTHDLATRHASAAPAPTTFRSPEQPQNPVVPPRPVSPPPPLTFRTARPSTPPLPPMRTATVPPELRFVPPVPPPPSPAPVTHTAIVPAPVTFAAPETAPVQRRARTHTPAPPVFRPASQPTQPSVTQPAPKPAAMQFRAPTSRRSSAPSGGEK